VTLIEMEVLDALKAQVFRWSLPMSANLVTRGISLNDLVEESSRWEK